MLQADVNDMPTCLGLFLQVIDLGHVVSVFVLALSNLALELGRMILVGLQVLQA